MSPQTTSPTRHERGLAFTTALHMLILLDIGKVMSSAEMGLVEQTLHCATTLTFKRGLP